MQMRLQGQGNMKGVWGMQHRKAPIEVKMLMSLQNVDVDVDWDVVDGLV